MARGNTTAPLGNEQARQGIPPFNPERPPLLAAKYAKLLGKDLDRIEIVFDATGVDVKVTGTGDYGNLRSVPFATYKAAKAGHQALSDEERLRTLRNKFELRLNIEFPSGNAGPASGSEADIQAFIQGLPFQQRRALLMTQKQFTSAYPNGFPSA